MLQSIKAFLNRARERHKSYREGREHDIFTIVHDRARLRVSWLTLVNETGETSGRMRDLLTIGLRQWRCRHLKPLDADLSTP